MTKNQIGEEGYLTYTSISLSLKEARLNQGWSLEAEAAETEAMELPWLTQPLSYRTQTPSPSGNPSLLTLSGHGAYDSNRKQSKLLLFSFLRFFVLFRERDVVQTRAICQLIWFSSVRF